jgi:hypothetical protein
MTKAFKELELLVAKIQKQLAPRADVLHDVHLDGRDSGTKRQIDVLVHERIGQYEIRIIVDCKDYNKPADVNDVGAFNTLLHDVGAQKGVLVCPKGFTSAAKAMAERYQIELYSPFDTDIHKWTVKATIPAICDFRSVMMSFMFATSAPLPFQLPGDFYSSSQIYDSDKPNRKCLGTALNNASRKWNDGLYPNAVGEHRDLKIFDVPQIYMDSGVIKNLLVPVDVTVSTYVQRELYCGQLPVPKVSGFKDEFTGKVITNSFQVGLLDPDDIARNWTLIESEDQAPIAPVISLVGTVPYGEDGTELHVPPEGGLS